MVQERSGTPERQLLKLIENPNQQGIRREEVKRKSSSLFSLAALKGRFSFLKGKLGPKLSFKKLPINIKGINIFLKVCIFLLVLYIATELCWQALDLRKGTYSIETYYTMYRQLFKVCPFMNGDGVLFVKQSTVEKIQQEKKENN